MAGRRFVYLLGFALLMGVSAPGRAAEGSEEQDEEFLEKARVACTDDGLLQFFRQRTLTDAQRRQIVQYVENLGSPRFKLRQEATRQLSRLGEPALPFLKQALHSPDVEVTRRAQACVHKIQKGPGGELPAAAVRVLVRRRPAGTVEVLLAFLPFAGDEAVAEEVLAGLTEIARQVRTIPPALVAALRDPLAARRGAAALVVGRLGDAARRGQVRGLLADPDFQVRLHAAYGLLAAHDRDAVPAVIALLGEAPRPVAWQAEALLARLAGEKAPGVRVGAGERAARDQARAAWEKWWRTEGPRLDWQQVDVGQAGGALVAELETDTVWESGPRGRPRWEVDELRGPYDVQPLGGGRLLVAEYLGQRVTERDRRGKILWHKDVKDPVSCQRLPNGNTLIATPRQVLECRPDGKEVYAVAVRKSRQPLYAAHKAPGGNVVYLASEAGLLVLDPVGPRVTLRKLEAGGPVTDVQGLANGHLLLTLSGPKDALLLEIDAAGKPVWQATARRACSATRLANRHVLAVSKSDRRLVELDEHGRKLWEKTTAGRPIRVHRR